MHSDVSNRTKARAKQRFQKPSPREGGDGLPGFGNSAKTKDSKQAFVGEPRNACLGWNGIAVRQILNKCTVYRTLHLKELATLPDQRCNSHCASGLQ
jgi:hypothetical protein